MIEAPARASRSIVALVDDDEPILSALARLVRTIGYAPRTFSSGERLLAEFDTLSPACVVTDVQMPGMNGLELMRRLLRLRPDLPILVMTAYPSLTNRAQALSGGAYEFMTKPLNDQMLEHWLLAAVGQPD